LSVNGRINTTNGTAIGTMNYGGGTVINMGAISAHPLQLITNNITRMTLDTTGNVGIGTATPGSRLSVIGPSYVNSGDVNVATFSTAAPGCAGFANMGGFIGVDLGQGAVNTSAYYGAVRTSCGAGVDLVLKGADSLGAVQERLRITKSGNVGIGTTAPNANLHIYQQTTGIVKIEGSSVGSPARRSILELA